MEVLLQQGLGMELFMQFKVDRHEDSSIWEYLENIWKVMKDSIDFLQNPIYIIKNNFIIFFKLCKRSII